MMDFNLKRIDLFTEMDKKIIKLKGTACQLERILWHKYKLERLGRRHPTVESVGLSKEH